MSAALGIALRCWLSPLLLALALAGCASTPSANNGRGQSSNNPACAVFVDAWVAHFQANVQRLDGQRLVGLGQQLQQARAALAAAGSREDECYKPMCIIEPKANGRLDSYCGYRISDESGAALYRWVRWEPSTR
jgi:hypothetical protein